MFCQFYPAGHWNMSLFIIHKHSDTGTGPTFNPLTAFFFFLSVLTKRIGQDLCTYLMALSSAFLMPVCSSVNTGSTLWWIVMSWPRALADFKRTARLGSLRALMKVVCSWGKNGFNMAPHWKRKGLEGIKRKGKRIIGIKHNKESSVAVTISKYHNQQMT